MRLILIVALIVFGQQAKPDLNGLWVVNKEKSAKAIKDGAVTHERIWITVTEKEMTIGDDVGRVVCGFGKERTESKSSRPMPPVVCSAKWDGDELVTTATRKPDPKRKDAPPETVTRLILAGTELTLTNKTRLWNGDEKKSLIVFEKGR